ncbi:MAG TPA: glycosyl hydrolase family 8 [Longimicrobium sp.]|jgi:hypothetical protein|uniref:glycosyl hydrolase family 8 n=1 Tax=Longimicrobium sp. TaxID=2029185 RepID=UPI002ED8E12E
MKRSTLAPLALAALLAACDDQPTEPGTLASAGGSTPRAALSTAGATPYPYRCTQSLTSNQAAANDVLRAKYEAWRTSRVSYEGAYARVMADGDFTYTDNNGTTQALPYATISEGHAYGMLLAAYMGDKKTFHAMEAYRDAKKNANGAMPWLISAEGVAGNSAATDADEDIAFALLLADLRWGGYWTPLNQVLASIKTHMVEPAGSTHAYLLKPADMPLSWWQAAFPGYMSPAWYKAFATYTGDGFWTQVSDKSYQYLASVDAVSAYGNGATGLLPDRTTPDGTLDADTAKHRFSWDAIRAPWRLAADAAWNCDTRAKGRVDKMNAFFNGTGPGKGPTGIGSIYRTNGEFLDDDLYGGPLRNPWFYGPLTSAALLSTDGAYKAGMWTETVNMTTFQRYGHELGLLGLLLASGNMYDPLAGYQRKALDEFESGDSNRWWTYADAGVSTLTKAMVWPAAIGHGMKVTHNVVSWAGIGTTVNQDWSGYGAIEFWIEGTSAGNTVHVEIEDADGELFRHSFVNDFSGWRFASVPLNTSGFPRRGWQPVATNNGMTLTNVKSFRFEPMGNASFGVDRIVLVP